MIITKSYNLEGKIIKKGASIITLEETINKKDVDSWHKDFQAFTKNLRRLKTREDIELVANAMIIFSDNLETFFYGNILGSKGSEYAVSYKDFEDSGPLEGYVDKARKNVWELIIYLKNIASKLTDKDYFGKVAVHYDDDNRPIEIDIYKKGVLPFEKYIDSTYQKLARLGREAFDSMEAIFDVKEEMQDLFITDTLKIQGIPTILTYREGKDVRELLNPYEKSIANAEKLCNKKGFKEIFKGVTLIVDTQRTGITKTDYSSIYGRGAGAFFSALDMTVNLGTYDLFSLIHELGHKYYHYSMHPDQRDLWKEFIENNTISMERQDVEKFIEKFARKIFDYYSDLNDRDKNPYLTSSQKSKKMTEYIDKNMDRFNLTELEYILLDVANSGIGKMSKYGEQWDLLFDSFYEQEKEVHDLKYLIEKISIILEYVGTYGSGYYRDIYRVATKNFYVSDYANTNEKEAYAEVFAKYVLDDYVSDLVLSQFYLTKPL